MTEHELAELDLAVARINFPDAQIDSLKGGGAWVSGTTRNGIGWAGIYQPTRDPAEAMRLLEKHRLNLECQPQLGEPELLWEVRTDDVCEFGETPCIAICKAVVALARAKEAA